MVMGHVVDHQLLKMVQQSLEHFRKEFAAVQEAVASLQDQQHFLQDQQQSLEGKIEEQKQRLDEMSAQQSEQARQVNEALARLHDDHYNQILEMFENLRTQLRQGMYAASFSTVNLFTSLSLSSLEKEKGLFVP